MTTRREFIKELLIGGAALAVAPRLIAFGAEANPWETTMPAILKRIRPPRFPNRTYYITRFGAKGDGKTDCTVRSEEHTSELQSQSNLVCRLLLEKKKKKQLSHTQAT